MGGATGDNWGDAVCEAWSAHLTVGQQREGLTRR